mmetsp:Transcript_11350/g.12978  ORF Transcript_11350/g.12978 Transcript_11350/m.12978 type:complete len:848 (-) Transcript_11350:230-2773(-)
MSSSHPRRNVPTGGGSQSRRGKGEDASHLVRFQYAEWGSSLGGTPATSSSSHSTSAPVRRIGGISSADANKIQLAFKLQTFQFVLSPDAVEAGRATPFTNLRDGIQNNKGGRSMRAAAPSNSHAISASAPSIAAAVVQSILGFDSMAKWEHVYAVVVRTQVQQLAGQDCDTSEYVAPHQCPICLEAVPCAPRITPCGHIFCLPCILRALHTQKESNQQRACPMCHSLLVPSMLKRCVFRECRGEATARDGSERTFVLVHRHRLSPLVYSHKDVHLVDAVRNVGSVATQELVVLPRVEEDDSWLYCRYSVATEEFHGLHDIMDRSSLEDRRATHLSSVVCDAQGSPQLNDDDQCELDAISNALETLDRYHLRRSSELNHPHTETVFRDPTSSGSCGGGSTSTKGCADEGDDGNGGHGVATPSSLYDFYMDAEGQQLYLHFVCTKMIHDDCVSRGVPMPTRISCKIVDVEDLQQSEQSRQILKPLAHIPLFGGAQACFADMKSLVSKNTLKLFQEVIDRRMARIQKQKDRAHAEERAAMSVDDAWEQHKAARRQADPVWRTLPPEHARGIFSNVASLSPTMQAFAIPLDDMPSLMDLPQSTASAGSSSGVSRGACGPSDSSVETRQRATKGHCGGQGLGIAVPLTAATLSNLHPERPVKNCWGGTAAASPNALHALPSLEGTCNSQTSEPPSEGRAPQQPVSAAVHLFGRGLSNQQAQAAPVNPSWGGAPFVNRANGAPTSTSPVAAAPSVTVANSTPTAASPPRPPQRRLISADDYEAYAEFNDDEDDVVDEDDVWGGRLRGRHQGKALINDQVRPSDMVGGSNGKVASQKGNPGSVMKVTRGKGKSR